MAPATATATATSGHYTADVRHKGNWYGCNDELITDVSSHPLVANTRAVGVLWQVVNKRKRDEPKASQSDQKESQSDQKASRARSRRRWAQLAQLAQLAVAEGWSGEVADFQKQ